LSKKEGSDWLEKGGPAIDDILTDGNMYELGSQPVNYLWDILHEIPKTMESDNKLFRVKEGKAKSEKNLHIIHPENTWIDESCILNPSIVIDSTQGSVIIDKNAEIGSFSYLEGPLFIGEKSKIHPLTKLKRSIIGPECRIGGEVDQTIIQGFSNKAHDGHLGDAFLGEWVNLGAGTNNSNLKNNYTSVEVTVHGSKIDTGNLFIGSFIGDHSKTAIGTQLNTGTSIGVGCNIVSKSFPPRNLPSFTWYINGRRVSAKLDKFIQTVSVVKNRRNKTFSSIERVFYEFLFHENHSEL
jgi:UDP-N-acetylglucosamine diphosphorylase/glucosamine-1-phosphate N-acetyltransferase